MYVDDDQTLMGFAHHYALFLLLCSVAGALAGAAYGVLSPRPVAASTIVAERGATIPFRQFGSVADTLFDSTPVLAPAADQLGMRRSELVAVAQLNPVPESNTVLVIGRAREIEEAKAISGAIASALVDALNEQTGTEDFFVFAPAEPAPNVQNLSLSVSIGLGAAIGFWLAFALSIVHYRSKRPLLTFSDAVRVSGAQMAAVVDGKWPNWLGLLRPTLAWSDSDPNLTRLARLRELAGDSYVHLDMGGFEPKSRQKVLASHGSELQKGRTYGSDGSLDEHDVRIVVADAGTGERVLATSRLTGGKEVSDISKQERIGLVWVR